MCPFFSGCGQRGALWPYATTLWMSRNGPGIGASKHDLISKTRTGCMQCARLKPNTVRPQVHRSFGGDRE
eukprot:10892613-Alexandrium_andersonii.AAC.1